MESTIFPCVFVYFVLTDILYEQFIDRLADVYDRRRKFIFETDAVKAYARLTNGNDHQNTRQSIRIGYSPGTTENFLDCGSDGVGGDVYLFRCHRPRAERRVDRLGRRARRTALVRGNGSCCRSISTYVFDRSLHGRDGSCEAGDTGGEEPPRLISLSFQNEI